AVTTGSFGAREVIVRINGLDTEWWLDDLNAVAKAKPDAVLVPKVSSPNHLEDVGERLVDISADQKIRVWAMMETPLAMLKARDMGFDGKTLIHPSQIGPCNAAFSPSAEDVAQAKKIIAAFDLPENEHKGVVQLDGRMVERLHADMARRTVAIAQAIEQRRLEAERV